MTAPPPLEINVNVADPSLKGLLQSGGRMAGASFPLQVEGRQRQVTLRAWYPANGGGLPYTEIDISGAEAALTISAPDGTAAAEVSDFAAIGEDSLGQAGTLILATDETLEALASSGEDEMDFICQIDILFPDQVYPQTVFRGSLPVSRNVAADEALALAPFVIFVDVPLSANYTLANPVAATDFKRRVYRFRQNSTGGWTVTLGNKFRIPSSSSLTSPLNGAAFIAPNAVNYCSAIYCLPDDKWDVTSFVPGY